MSRTVEQKVVEMQFDNSNFEKNVSTSMGTLNKLQDTISKTTSGNAFAEIGKAANNLNFSGLGVAIQSVGEKFSVLEQLAIGALRNIGAHIEQELVAKLKAVTFDQIEAGFQRFSDMTESTQTILSAIATEDYGDINKLEYTEDLLEKLAWFADETSYNFTDMTSNISKFTAAGLDLSDSTTAMMGIANWAANAGQNATTASRAMYQLSQAMGMGSIKLMDWKSIETANMATKEVKELLLKYAALSKESALKVDETGYYFENVTKQGTQRIDVDSKSFRESLRYGWLTADAFSDAMGEYASYSEALYKIIDKNKVNADGSTMIASDLISAFDEAIEKSKETGKSLEDIMMEDYKIDIMVDDGNGGLESAMKNVTELGIRAMKSAQQARTWAQVMDSVTDAASTRWSFIFKHIFGNVEEATELFTNLANYFYDIFVEPINNLEGLFNEWNELGGRTLLFEGEESALANLEEALSGFLDAIKEGFASVFPPKTAEDLLNATKRFKDFTATLVLTEAQSKKITNAVSKVLSVLKTFASIVSTAFKTVSRIFTQVKDTFLSVFTPNWLLPARTGFKDFFDAFTHALNRILGGIRLSDGAISKLKDIFGGVRSVINALGEAFGWLAEKIKGIGDNTLDKVIGRFIGGNFLEFLLLIPSKIGKAITSVIEFVKTSEGLKKFISTLSTAVYQIKEFFRGFFDAMFPEGIGKVIGDVKDKIVGLFDSMKGSEKFQKAKDKVKSFLDTVKQFFKDKVTYEKGVETFNKLKNGIIDFGDKVKNAFNKAKEAVKAFVEKSKTLQSLGDWFKNLFKPKDVEEGSENAETFGQKVLKVLGTIWNVIKKIGEGIKNLWAKVKELWQNLGIGEWLKNTFSGVGAFFKNIIDSIAEALTGMTDADSNSEKLKKVFEFFKGIIGDIVGIIVKILPGVAVGAGGIALGSGLKSLIDFFSSPFKDLFSSVGDFLSGISDSISKIVGGGSPLEKFAKAITDILKSLSIFVIALAAFIFILSKIENPETIAIGIGSIATLLGEISGIMMILMNFSGNGAGKNASNALKAISKVFTAMGIAIILVALAVSVMVKAIDGKDIQTVLIGIGAIALLLAEIAGITVLLMNVNSGGTGKGAGKALNGVALTLIAMAAAVAILASVVKSIGQIDTETLIKGTVAVGILVILTSLFASVASGTKGVLGAGIGLIAMAAAIKIMANVARTLGEIDTQNLIKGIVAVGVLTIFAALLAVVAGQQSGLLTAGIGLVLMAAAISIMSSIAKDLGAMESGNMWQGILAVAALTGLLAILALIAGHTKGLLKAGIALAAMAAAVAVVGGILIAIAAFAKSDGGNEAIWDAIVAVAVALLTLVAVGYLVGPVAVPLLAFAAAVALLGAGLLAFAAAASIFIATLILITTTSSLTAAAIGLAISEILMGIVEAGPALVEALGTIINSLLSALLNSKALIIETVLEFITGLLETLAEYLPRILDSLGVILDSIWEFLTERFITFIESLHDVWLVLHDNLKEDLDILADDIHEGIQKVISYIDEDLNSIADNIYDFTMKIADQIFGGGEYEGLIPRLLRGLEESAVNFWTSAKNIISAFGEGIDECAIIAISAFGTLITDVIDSIADFNEDLLRAVEDFIFSLADSIKNHGTNIVIGITRIITNLMDIMFLVLGGDETQEGSLAYLAKYFWDGLWAALKARADAFGEKVKGLAKKVLPDPVCKVLGIQSPSKVAMEIGEYFMDGLAIGVENGEEDSVDAVTDAADSIKSAMSKAMSTIDTLLSDDEYQPTITPVMDLSQIQNGMYTMGNLLNTYDNYTMQAAVAANYNPYTYQDGTIKVDTETQMADSIATLENKFDEMLYKLGKIRVVLDSGTLVGELVDPMDEALGRKAVYVGRGM